MYLLLGVGVVVILAAAGRIKLMQGGGAPGLMVGAYGLLLGVGMLGFDSGVVMTFKTVATAALEEKQTLLASGLAVSSYVPLLAVVLSVPLMLLHAGGDLLAAASARQATRADRVATVASAVLGVLLARVAWSALSLFRLFAEMSSLEEASAERAASMVIGLYATAFEALFVAGLGAFLVVFGLVVGVKRLKNAPSTG